MLCLLAGAVVVAVMPLLMRMSPVLEVSAWAVVQGMAALAVVTMTGRHGLSGLWPWRLMRLGVVIIWLSTALAWGVGWVGLHSEVSLAVHNVAKLAAYGLSLVALIMFSLRSSAGRGAALLDAGLITVGTAMPMWTFVIEPAIDRSTHTGADLMFTLALPVIDLFFIGLVMRLALDNGRAPWLVLLSGAYGAMFLADGAHLMNKAAGHPAGTLSVIGWMAWSVLIAAAALHPSLATGARLQDPVAASRVRVTLFLFMALFSPLVCVIGQMTLDLDTVVQPHDAFALIGLTVLLAVLLVARLSVVARLAEEHQRSLTRTASQDPLTGLANRSLLGEALQQAITDTAPGAPPPALLLLDLDGFKDVNDSFGHPIGDGLLVQVATRLRALNVNQRTLARLGGDEFALVLPGAAVEEALTTARRILTVLRAPYRLAGHEMHLSASVGVLAGVPVESPTEALRDADLALYAAKHAGKDQLVLFHPDLRKDRLERTRLTLGLRQAVTQRELTLVYQPVVDLDSGEICKVEALVRWTPTGSRPVPPDVFIPIAEDSGQIVAIGTWVLEQACADARRWHESHGIAVTVNVSGRQLREPDFAEKVLDILARHDLPERALVLEITESMLLATTPAETARIIAALTGLREHGVRIALDDFGTGYSSLSYLRTLPVDILKIDKSFTPAPQHPDYERMRVFTKAITELSAGLGLKTVIEGVETQEQAVLLQQLGCLLAQGYLFSPPVGAAQIDALLDQEPRRQVA
ncbi:putative bifunctional diguanylate cyclase/phosphodiesterase [Planobispora siamensis]|uniref:Diguanylate cyclase (GGDEF) domain-containing protein n=1 Tax=Planobispora siamensis TaxID=936338 RepID=A0A8J3SKN0_9ACTN|nr:bifunctional diguanylate cyclase/phosphodiesterase [Planobispora siamensis]GIH96022.1 hypothetical protein Psi01_66520 [Planobispora siamensis]